MSVESRLVLANGQFKFTYFGFQNPESFLESLSTCALLPMVPFDPCYEAEYIRFCLYTGPQWVWLALAVTQRMGVGSSHLTQL